jgi:enoyl-CoA hydratase/carnithine racemase
MTATRDEDGSAGLGRRQFLAASAAAAAVGLNLNGTAVAQNEKRVGAADAQRSTVAVDTIDGGVLLIGIDRDEQNFVDPATFVALGRAFYRLDHDDDLRVGVLYGRGANFSPGIDVPAWAATLSARPFNPNATDFINPLSTVPPLRAKPVVAAVHGATKFFGHELFLACDLRVAATDTVFSQGEVTRALFPAGGGTIRFVREAGWGNAMRYMLTGEEWGAEESYRLGLTQAVTPPGKELERAVDFAKKIASAAPLGVRATLASAQRALAEGETAAFGALLPEFAQLFRTEDFQARLRAARENRLPVYRGR